MNFKTHFSNIKGDLMGGITAGVVALPLSLAFGEQTELGAIAGLYGAIALGLLAIIFGGTHTQISGPTAPMTVVSAVIISKTMEFAGGLEAALPMIFATFFLSGLIQVFFGIIRLGKFIRYIPYPVISGFMSGIGVIIIIAQIFPFFGINTPPGGAFATLSSLHLIPEQLNVYSVGMALLAVLIIYLFPKITKKFPSTLVALIVITLLAFFFLPDGTFLKINSKGPIPTGLPALQLSMVDVFSNFKYLKVILEYAITLAALGSIDSLLTSVVADNMTKTRHNSNKELIGQGIGNMGAAFIGGLPGAGATMRTVININSGGKFKLSGVIAALLLFAVLLGLGSLVGHIPNAVLAGILITVGIGIIDYRGLKHLFSIPRSDAIVLLLVLFLTVFVDLLVAVGAGMVMAALLFMKNISDVIEQRTRVAPLREFSPEITWDDEKEMIEHLGDKVLIKHLDGPVFFGFAAKFQEMELQTKGIKAVVIRMDKVPYVDQSGLYAMEEVILNLYEEKIPVAFVDLHGQPLEMFRKIDLIPDLVKEELNFPHIRDCALWLESFMEKQQ